MNRQESSSNRSMTHATASIGSCFEPGLLVEDHAGRKSNQRYTKRHESVKERMMLQTWSPAVIHDSNICGGVEQMLQHLPYFPGSCHSPLKSELPPGFLSSLVLALLKRGREQQGPAFGARKLHLPYIEMKEKGRERDLGYEEHLFPAFGCL